MHLPLAGIYPKIAPVPSPKNIAREENAFPHTLIVQRTEAPAGDGSITLLERSLFAKPGEGCSPATEILILASLRKAPNEHLSF